MADLGGPQISALLESVPGIANVLRSPVADALVGMIRAGARIGEFRPEHAGELVQFAVRRGLIGNEEGDRVLEEVRRVVGKRPVPAAQKPAPVRGPAAPPRPAANAPRKPVKASKPVKARKAAARKAKRR